MFDLAVNSGSKPLCLVWLTCALLGFFTAHTHSKLVLSVPEQVTLSGNSDTQQLSITWQGGEATTFDLIILRTEFNETIFYDTVSPTVNQQSGQRQWNWTSVEPLECTSLSVKLRSRDGPSTSEWSDTRIYQHLPTGEKTQLFPVEKIYPVGTNTTFCCILGEGATFKEIRYGSATMNVTRLSQRSYAFTAYNQELSGPTGTNIFCRSNPSSVLGGTVVFVGYPPQPSDLVCETYDLTSAVCRWNEGRDTGLYGKKRKTSYLLNKRDCATKGAVQKQKECKGSWEGNWTLVADNHLGQYTLTDSAELSHRVRPVAPEQLLSNVHSWNATVEWQWKYNNYSSLALVCQVELTSEGYKTKRIFSGIGLRSVTLSGLYPDEDYSVVVRCGSQKNFWAWGNWSEPCYFRTKTYVPDTLDVWMWMNRDNTAKVFWKPLTRKQSRGQIKNYEVTLWNQEENRQHTEILPPDTFSVSVNLTQMTSLSSDGRIIATVTVKNTEWVSQPASVTLYFTDLDFLAPSMTSYTDGGFPLSWQSNSTCSFVVEWHEASCEHDCPVEWIKFPAGTTNTSIESVDFQPGVRYSFSLYSCPSDSPELLQRWEGYSQELVPSRSVPLWITQQQSDVLLTWGEIPLLDRRGFVQGFNVYMANDSQLTLLANLSDQETRSYTVKGLSQGSYKFTVKTYTSAGEDTGTTASITLKPFTDWLILEILASLGIVSLLLAIFSFICYKKRKWVKNTFYPDIPEPKLSSDWSRTQGPLDVKPSPHNMVHIVEKPEWDSSKEALVVIPEEDEFDDGQGIGDEPVDTDEPTSLRYYNQVVDDRPIRPRFPDSTSSASSLDSAQTDVTYTGIQTSGSSLVFQLDQQNSSEGRQPPVDLSVSSGGGGGGGYRPQMQPRAQAHNMGLASPESFQESQAASTGGYKPQSSWQLDSQAEAAERGSLAPSLGSPTSVASTHFLLPDGEEEEKQQSSSAATWFSNLLSSTKP